ncbi:ABC transporter ATP-binding protein [Sporolactobacillus terrae]|uniref:ABC transporter ATP-binding protein n=1 Tax=Sporolactobacillus terrae TaxID=269673 RepID=UPI00111976D5|nr:ABC transporter ATP-binding protein [Sporolactobacillus terrae]
MSLLSLNDVSVAYGPNTILKDLNLTVEKGELLSLLGPSGCGKTTTLRLIAGFLQAKTGQFLFNAKDYTRLPINKRHFGFVFQNYALFPHLTVFDNIAFGLRLRKMDKKTIEKKIKAILQVVNLTGFEKRFPAELSGGQRQRVAIARALVIEPDLLLFDEPLSNLDANLRVTMREEIRRIQQELGITAIYVSHDQEECFSISDKVAILNHGMIEQIDQPKKIYRYPKSEFVAQFIGFKNFITCSKRANDGNDVVFSTAHGQFRTTPNADVQSETSLKLAIRPDDIELCAHADAKTAGENFLTGQIQLSTFLGKAYQYKVLTPLGVFHVNCGSETEPLAVGTTIHLFFPMDKLVNVD